MNPVRQAIYDELAGDATLSAIAPGGIHWRQVDDEEPTYPLVIFDKPAGSRTWAFDGPPMLGETYLVKGVGFADDAEAIDNRCLEVLTYAQLAVDGRRVLLKPMPNDDVGYAETLRGERYDHVGTNYRVVTEATS